MAKKKRKGDRVVNPPVLLGDCRPGDIVTCNLGDEEMLHGRVGWQSGSTTFVSPIIEGVEPRKWGVPRSYDASLELVAYELYQPKVVPG